MRECAAGFARRSARARPTHPGFARGGVPILPTPVRLGAPEARRARGVTIAFLDSGFYAHPDLVEPRDRILALRRRQRRRGRGAPTSTSPTCRAGTA